jgi:hypothetical protein
MPVASVCHWHDTHVSHRQETRGADDRILAGRADVVVDPRAIDNPDLLDWYCEQGQRHTW